MSFIPLRIILIILVRTIIFLSGLGRLHGGSRLLMSRLLLVMGSTSASVGGLGRRLVSWRSGWLIARLWLWDGLRFRGHVVIMMATACLSLRNKQSTEHGKSEAPLHTYRFFDLINYLD